MVLGEQFFYINNRIIDVRGLAVAAVVSFYLTGTTALEPIYDDPALATPHANPFAVNAGAAIPNIWLDPSIIYRVRIVAETGEVISDYDPYDPISASSLAFVQDGTGAVARTVQDKLRDTVSVRDFGAIGDGTTDESDAFAYATASLADGGSIDIAAGTYKVGQQFYGPSRGNVHAFDVAIIGTNDIVTNPNFSGSPATGWTLSNFTSNNPGITHATGTIGSAKRSVTVSPYTMYLAVLTIQTTTAGDVTFYLDGRGEFNEDEGTALAVGTVTLKLPFLTGNSAGAVDFEFRTADTAWAGKVTQFSLIKVQREAPYDFFSLAADGSNFNNPFGIKFGRFVSGNIGIGDRQTNGLIYGTNGAWNVAVGSRANGSAQENFENTAIGALALEYNQVDRNTALGYSALRYNTLGIQNTGLGYKTFGRNSVGSNNTGAGFWACLYSKTGSDNSAFGKQAGYYNLYGNSNSFFGSDAGLNAGGNSGVYIGALTGPNTPGEFRFTYNSQTCIGAESKAYGSNSTAIGYQAQCGSDPNSGGTATTNGAVAIGEMAKATDSCVAIGVTAGNNLTGTNNVTVGHGANNFGVATNYSNVTTLGYGASATASNQLTVGNATMTAFRAPTATITVISDRRDKTNITGIEGAFACDFLKALSPVRWEWNMRGDMPRFGGDVGFIAQDLLEVQDDKNAGWLGLVNDSDPNHFEATPGKLLPVLVAALQDALARIEALEGA